MRRLDRRAVGRLMWPLAVLAVAMASLTATAAGAAIETPPQPDPTPAELELALAASKDGHGAKRVLFETHRMAMATGNFTAFNAVATSLNRRITGTDKMDVVGTRPDTPAPKVQRAASYTTNWLGLSHVAQQYWNYCGPASGAMQANYQRAFFGWGPVAQTDMASWMGTGAPAGPPPLCAACAGTNISGYLNGLNVAIGWYYGISNSLPAGVAGSNFFWDAMTLNVDAWWSSGVDATEFPNKTYNGHPAVAAGSNRGHYIVNYGYYQGNLGPSGGGLYFLDPAANSSVGWPNAQPTFAYSSKSFYDKFMGIGWASRGIIW